MNIIFGFGEHHKELTRDFCKRLLNNINGAEDFKAAADKFAEKEGTFKDKGWRNALVKAAVRHEIYPGSTVFVIEGTYSHYRDDHPMSPDGYASLSIPWCVTIFESDVWGERTYINVL